MSDQDKMPQSNDDLDDLYHQILSKDDSEIAVEAARAQAALKMIERVRKQQSSLSPSKLELGKNQPLAHQSTVNGGETIVRRDDQQVLNDLDIPTEIGRFSIKRLLGKGGFGMVFLAHDPNLGRDVALKIPHAETVLNPQLKARFVREGRAAASLAHPNVVPVFESGQFGSICYLASFPVDGTPLSIWASGQTADNYQAAEIVRAVADGLAHAHQRGIVHRDIKPANILVQNDDSIPLASRVQITDFGLAKNLSNDSDDTGTHDLIGTPAYMSPEQALQQQATQVSDIYSAGAVLYFLLTGRPPFERDSILETATAVVDAAPKIPKSINSNVDVDLQAICLKCLEKAPAHRYPSAVELREDLSRFIDGLPVEVRPLTAATRIRRWCKRNPAIAALLSAATVLLAIAFAATVFGLSQRNHSLQRELAAQKIETIALANEQTANEKAQQRYVDLKNAIDTYFLTVIENKKLKSTPGAEAIRKELLSLALSHYESYVIEKREDNDLIKDVAKAEYQIANILNEIDRHAEALEHSTEAVLLLRELQTQEIINNEVKEMLALSLVEAFTAHRAMGNRQEAGEFLDEATVALGQLYEGGAGNNVSFALAQSKMDAALSQLGDGNTTSARELYEEARTIYKVMSGEPDRSSLPKGHAPVQPAGHAGIQERMLMVEGQLALVAKTEGDDEESIRIREACFKKWQNIVSKAPDNWVAVDALVVEGLNLTLELFNLGRSASSRKYLILTKVEINRLHDLFPDNGRYRHFKGSILQFEAAILGSLENQKANFGLANESVDFARQSLVRSPRSKTAAANLIEALANLTEMKVIERVDLATARREIDEAIERCQKMAKRNSDPVETKKYFAMLYRTDAKLCNAERRFAEAEMAAQKGLIICNQMIEKEVNQHHFRLAKSALLLASGDANHGLRQTDRAIDFWQQVIALNAKGTKNRIEKATINIAAELVSRDQYDDAAELVSDFESAPRDVSMFNQMEMARFYCLAAAADDDSQEQLSRAVSWIENAADKGFFSSASRVAYFRAIEELHVLHDDPTVGRFLEKAQFSD